MATFNETRAPTSRKYVSEQAIVMPNWSKTFQNFWSHSFVFALENNLKIKISRVFLPLKDILLDTFSETRAPTSRKHVSEQSIVMSNWSMKFQTFWSHSSAFPLEKQPKNINFQSFFISNRPFAGYFQWNACIYFQKICMWRRYSGAKFIKNVSNFFVALLHFGFRKEPKNLNFHSFCGSNRPFVSYFQWDACTYFQKICIWTRYSYAKLIKNISNFCTPLFLI